MSFNFFFMDDCDDVQHSRIFSLTGIVVPSTKYRSIRDEFYTVLDWAIKPKENHLNLSPPEIHGSNLHPKLGFDGCEKVVDLVLKHQLQIFRVGYYSTKVLRSPFKGNQPPLLSMCWASLQTICQPIFEEEMLVPIMDGLDKKIVSQLSAPNKSMDVMRTFGYESGLSIRNSENVSEVFYADSYYSVLTQVVDMVSYLLHVTDWLRKDLDLTPFKMRLSEISSRLEPCIVREEIVEMRTLS